MKPRFAFIVHALSPLHRGAMGVRRAAPGLALQRRDGSDPADIGIICRLSLPEVEGVVVGVPLLPEAMLADPERAVDRMAAALEVAGPVAAAGLGSLCAVIAGRGEALAERVGTPITTGAAATAWALAANARLWIVERGGPVALIGAAGPVGGAVAAMLAAEGVDLRIDSRRTAKKLGIQGFDAPPEAAAGCPVVIGAGPTGGALDAAALAPGAVVVDVAIPGTIRGPLPPGTAVYAGEAVTTPPGWRRGLWGSVYHLLAGYGLSQVYACLAEPLVMAVTGRREPYALGRQVSLAAVEDLGMHASKLGFTPRRLPERGLRRWA